MALGQTPHIRLHVDKAGQLFIVDQVSKEKLLIQMRSNPDGTKTSRETAAEVEDLIWNFRWDHQKPVKAAEAAPDKKTPTRSRKAPRAAKPAKSSKVTAAKAPRRPSKSSRKPKIDLAAPVVTPPEEARSD